ncbi:MAG: DNA-binding domain-containing protein [Polyangiaceae bacterium]
MSEAPVLEGAQAFLQALFRLDDKIVDQPELAASVAVHVTGNDRLSPSEQADLYREQFFLRHLESLQEDHVGLVHFLGDELFERLARAYLRAHPPRTPSLRELGADFARFVATWDGVPEELRELCVDMARYELTIVDLFDAADVPAPDGERLAKIPEDVWLTRPLVWTPHLRLLASAYPVPELRIVAKKAIAARDADGPSERAAPPPREAAYHGLFRRDDVVVFERLSAEAFRLLVLLTGGASLASACDQLSATMSAEESAKVESEVGEWFRRWASWGWILDVKAR